MLAASCYAMLASPPPARADLAIVVSRQSKVEDLTLGELERVLRQDRRYWQANQPIRLILPAPQTTVRATLLRVVLKKSEIEYQQFVVGRLFRGDIAMAPRVTKTVAELRQAVASDPNALGVLDSSEVDASVRALRIDGRAPLAPDYPLR